MKHVLLFSSEEDARNKVVDNPLVFYVVNQDKNYFVPDLEEPTVKLLVNDETKEVYWKEISSEKEPIPTLFTYNAVFDFTETKTDSIKVGIEKNNRYLFGSINGEVNNNAYLSVIGYVRDNNNSIQLGEESSLVIKHVTPGTLVKITAYPDYHYNYIISQGDSIFNAQSDIEWFISESSEDIYITTNEEVGRPYIKSIELWNNTDTSKVYAGDFELTYQDCIGIGKSYTANNVINYETSEGISTEYSDKNIKAILSTK